MKFEQTFIQGLYLAELNKIEDERGAFTRLFCKSEFKNIGFSEEIVQINHSVNVKKGTFRGFHFQKPPYAETKMVRCLTGEIIDFVIDLRKNSPTFLQHFKVKLSENNPQMLIIPKGCAHGFQTLKAHSTLLYFHTQLYNRVYDSGVNLADPVLNIKLPLDVSEISEKDKLQPMLASNFLGLDLNSNT